MRPLFRGVEILGLKQHHERLAREAVDRLSPKMLDEDEVDVASRIVAMLTPEPPVIDESRLYAVRTAMRSRFPFPLRGISLSSKLSHHATRPIHPSARSMQRKVKSY
jgi:hypothetical protein